MRLHEFIDDDEWKRLQQLIYISVWQALSSYRQQRVAQYIPKHLAVKPKPQVAKKVRALAARNTKRPPQTVAPKPLPKPLPKPKPTLKPRVNGSPAYQPVNAPTPLPAVTKSVAARVQPIPQLAKPPNSLKPLPTSVLNPINNKLPTPNDLAKNQSAS